MEDNPSGENDEGVNIEETLIKRSRLTRQTVQTKKICPKDEKNASIKRISVILQKSENDRSLEETQMLTECSEEVEEVQMRWRRRDEAKRRLEEYEDPEDVLKEKCHVLAQAIAQSQHLVVYTGAGISTAAKIPDYRGPNGIWTRLQQGKDVGNHDLTLAEPTYTHMALSSLYHRNILKYVVSQNCDGLHLRSGLPRRALSELHGNMYIEVCKNCKPHREYWRRFDVTENTARYSHKTSRRCYVCNEPLVDTIVHFGERGKLLWPLNWAGACRNAERATTILCLGSSLKVLKKYPWLWRMDKPAKKRPNLYIVNLQWTPKDDCANVKINGRCDMVMRHIMETLGINVSAYDKTKDPIFVHATNLNDLEVHTTTQPHLEAVKEETENKFSIDNILKEDTGRRSVLTQHQMFFNSEAYSFLNLLQPHPIFGPYIYYPYQTSFLYSGLHSIIRPDTSTDVVTKIEDRCNFCYKTYDSDCCLFYKSNEPVFCNQRYRFSKVEKKDKPNVCLCCDYTTDEDEAEEEKDVGTEAKASMRSNNPGWFGKGCKKGRRSKRK